MKDFLSSKKMMKALIIMILFLIIIATGFFIASIFHDNSDNDLQQVQNIYEEIFKGEETQNENIILTAVIEQEETRTFIDPVKQLEHEKREKEWDLEI